MSDSAGKQVPPGMQAIFATGQAMAQGFFDVLTRQHVAMQDSSGVAAPKLPMPESEVMAAMQKEYAEKHAALWSSMLARKPGEAGEAVLSARLNLPQRRSTLVYWEVGCDARRERRERHGLFRCGPDLRVTLTGLEAGRMYWYRCWAGGHWSGVGHFFSAAR